jgi:hypothetical protein
MIDRLILSAVLGTVGWSGLFSDPPAPLTARQLMQKAKEGSKSQVCKKPKKSKDLKKLCERWGRHE